MMSSTMIVSGLSDTSPRLGTVELGPGMEFLPGVMIDQHFTQRGRIGRLLSAIAQYPHMIGIGIWSDAEHDKLRKELEVEVIAAQKEAERFGSLADGHLFSNSTMFDDIYKDVPDHLRRQRRQLGV